MEPLKYSRSKPTCRLSDPAHPHTLSRQYESSDPPLTVCFVCAGEHSKFSKYHYYCDSCDLEFHRGCHEFPWKIIHPSHPIHPLTLTTKDANFHKHLVMNRRIHYTMSDTSDIEDAPVSVEPEDDSTQSDEDYSSENEASELYERKGNYKTCKCCRRRLEDKYYHCSICKFNLNLSCVAEPPPLTITNKKTHDHSLTLFSRLIPLPCDACGVSLGDKNDRVYACLPCNYMVHRKCIKLPRVIKITRHPHRLSYTSSLPSGKFSCGVCHQTVNVNYGQYSCERGCSYAVHSKCATLKDVWDGEDLYGIPEEPDEDIEPFVTIDEETIKHFTHGHYLKIHEKKSTSYESKSCQACTLHILTGDHFYSGVQCDYILHQTCACLPRKKHHHLHKHPLVLHPVSTSPIKILDRRYSIGLYWCDGCNRRGSGFVYECEKQGCEFQLDIGCASLPDPLIHGSHPRNRHSLFFTFLKGKCLRCKSSKCSRYYLTCMKCKIFLGLRCATLPSEVFYKHDKHALTLHYGEEDTKESDQYWCEICESKLDPKTWFYTCDSCRVTVHVDCLLGETFYMKLHHIIKSSDYEVEVVGNDSNSRPLCVGCKKRCVKNLIFGCKSVGYMCGLFCAHYLFD